MNAFRNMSLALRLALAFGLLLALLVLNGLSGMYSARQVQSKVENLHGVYLPALDFLIEADRDLQQLLVAERTLLESEPGSDQFKSLLDDYNENLQQSGERWGKYTELAQSSEEQALFPQHDAAREAWLGVTAKVIEGAQSGDPAVRAAARELSLGEASAKFETMRDVIDQCTELNLAQADTAHEQTEKDMQRSRLSLIGISLFSLLIGLLLATTITRRITLPLRALSAAAGQMAEGDFTTQLAAPRSGDEIGRMQLAFAGMQRNTRSLIAQLAEEAQGIAAASEELSAAADENNRGVQQVVEIVASISRGSSDSVANMRCAGENLQQTNLAIGEVSRDVEDMASFATQTAEQGENGRQAALRAVEVINRAASSVRETTGVVEALGEKTAQISQFIGIITSIADQTNLLALNAAIEAARAGDAGRGFAVVAEEVRKLAEESNSAAGNITALVKSISEEMQIALAAMARSDREVTQGAQSVSEAGELFGEIMGGVKLLHDKVQTISATAQELSASSSEVTRSVEEVGEAASRTSDEAANAATTTQQQMGSMEEIASSTNLLASSAEQLNSLVRRFKV